MIYLCQPLGRQNYINGNSFGRNMQEICLTLLLELSLLVIISCTHSPPNSLYPPVTTSTREHSVSVTRRLETYLRATMGQERMSELTLMHIHYDVNWMLVK